MRPGRAAPPPAGPLRALDHSLVGVEVAHHLVERPWGNQHVVTAGPPDGPAVVLVHGWPQHWFAWRYVIAALAPTTRVLALDVRGFGWSDSEEPARTATIAGLGDDIVAVLDHFHVPDAVLVAHDWGGWIGFRAVIDHPGRFRHYAALSIVAPWLSAAALARRSVSWAYVVPMAMIGNRVARRPVAVRWLINHSATVPVWAETDSSGPTAMGSYLDRIGRGGAAAMSRHLYATLLRTELPAALGQRPPRLRVSTTMLVGQDETIARPELYWPRTDPRELEVVTVPGARHWLAEEAPAAVIEHLTTILERTRSTSVAS